MTVVDREKLRRISRLDSSPSAEEYLRQVGHIVGDDHRARGDGTCRPECGSRGLVDAKAVPVSFLGLLVALLLTVGLASWFTARWYYADVEAAWQARDYATKFTVEHHRQLGLLQSEIDDLRKELAARGPETERP